MGYIGGFRLVDKLSGTSSSKRDWILQRQAELFSLKSSMRATRELNSRYFRELGNRNMIYLVHFKASMTLITGKVLTLSSPKLQSKWHPSQCRWIKCDSGMMVLSVFNNEARSFFAPLSPFIWNQDRFEGRSKELRCSKGPKPGRYQLLARSALVLEIQVNF